MPSMDETIERIRESALRHAKTATRLWREARSLRDNPGDAWVGRATVARVYDLNRKAIDESRQAINGFEFLKRYPSDCRSRY